MISVIIPVYNREHTIRRAVDSVLRQSCQDFELILVDDGSTDGSPEICQSYARQDKRIRFFRHKENRGVSAARNTGLKEASGQYIRFLDSDDELPEKSLEDQLGPFLEDCTLGLVVGCNGGDHGKPPDFTDRPMATGEFLGQCVRPGFRCLYETPGNKLYLRDVVERNGLLFDETVGYGEDTFFNFRYYACIDKIYLLNRTVYLVHHPNWEPGHLSDVRNQDIGEIFRQTAIRQDVYRNATKELPDCRRGYAAIALEFLWISLCSIDRLGDYPSFKNEVNRYDWEELLEEPDGTYCWKLRFLCNALRKKRAGRVFLFFQTVNLIQRLKERIKSNKLCRKFIPVVKRIRRPQDV